MARSRLPILVLPFLIVAGVAGWLLTGSGGRALPAPEAAPPVTAAGGGEAMAAAADGERVAAAAAGTADREILPAPADRQPEISGRLVTAAGAPLPAVDVQLHRQRAADPLMVNLRGVILPQARAESDGQGRFRVSVPAGHSWRCRLGGRAWRIAGDDPHGDLAIGEVSADLDLGDIEVVPLATLSGVVRDPSGRGAAGVTVRVGGPGFVGATRLQSEPTDASGEFAIVGVEPGTRTLLTASPDYLPAELEVEVPAGSDLPGIELTVQHGATIAGMVVDDTGKPVAAARVAAERGRDLRPGLVISAISPEEAATTDAAGRFVLRGVGGPAVNLSAWSDGHARTTEAGVAAGATDVVLRLRRHGRVAGVLVDAAGAPIAGSTVTVDAGGEGFAIARAGAGVVTAGDGSFTTGGIDPGMARVTARGTGHRDVVSDPIEIVPGQTRTGLRLVAERGAALVLTVVDPDGSPVAGAQVVVSPYSEPETDTGGFRRREVRVEADDDSGAIHFDDGSGVERRVTTDAGGVARAAGLPAGRYAAAVRHAEFARANFGPYDVPASGEVGHRVGMVRGGQVAVTVIGPDQRPLAGQRVRVAGIDALAARDSGTTDARGSVRLGPLVPGVYSARLLASRQPTAVGEMTFMTLGDDDEALASAELTVVEGETTAVVLRRPPEIRVRGTVVDGAGPLAEAVVQILTEDDVPDFGARFSATTDAAGSFTIEGVRPGSYTVRYRHPDGLLFAEQPLTVAADPADVELELRLAAGSVRVRMTDKDGDPVAGAKVTMQAVGSEAPADRPRRPRRAVMMVATTVDGGSGPQTTSIRSGPPGVTTDIEGIAEFDHVPAGRYSIVAAHGRYAQTTKDDVTVIADRPLDVGTVVMEEGGVIAGTVSIEDRPPGGPVGIALVEWTRAEDPTARDVQPVRGNRFRFDGLVAGTYKLRAGEPGDGGIQWGEEVQVILRRGAEQTVELRIR